MDDYNFLKGIIIGIFISDAIRLVMKVITMHTTATLRSKEHDRFLEMVKSTRGLESVKLTNGPVMADGSVNIQVEVEEKNERK